MLECQLEKAAELFFQLRSSYPVVLTRNISPAKEWLKNKARGSERYGIVASSGALRLRKFGINVKSEVNPIHWFLNSKTDVRSSFFLEDVATEFEIQGLELDWACVAWDANFRMDEGHWTCHRFQGTNWQFVRNSIRQIYLKNSYRVLLTRARQGMVIFVPEGDSSDQTRDPRFYNSTFDYLRSIGIAVI